MCFSQNSATSEKLQGLQRRGHLINLRIQVYMDEIHAVLQTNAFFVSFEYKLWQGGEAG